MNETSCGGEVHVQSVCNPVSPVYIIPVTWIYRTIQPRLLTRLNRSRQKMIPGRFRKCWNFTSRWGVAGVKMSSTGTHFLNLPGIIQKTGVTRCLTVLIMERGIGVLGYKSLVIGDNFHCPTPSHHHDAWYWKFCHQRLPLCSVNFPLTLAPPLYCYTFWDGKKSPHSVKP
jgi:hypothetical protein